MVDPCFPEKQQHDWRYVYVCISYRKLCACIRIILHSLKYHVTKASNRKKWLSALGRMQRLDDLCLLLTTDIGSTRRSESRAWQWWVPTERCRICISRWWIPNYRSRIRKLRWGSWDPAGSPNLTPAHNSVSEKYIRSPNVPEASKVCSYVLIEGTLQISLSKLTC